jgi:hypothetical protein
MQSMKIKRALFPVEMRCDHLRDKTTCVKGCYILETGGARHHQRCSRKDCQGHVYSERVKKNAKGETCFGKRGHRLVCKET